MIARIFLGAQNDEGDELVGSALVEQQTGRLTRTHWLYFQYNLWTQAERDCVEKVLALRMTPETRSHSWDLYKQEGNTGHEYIAELKDRRGLLWKPVAARSAKELASGIEASYTAPGFPKEG